MAFDLNRIETIVIVLMENRSFDHMLGHLSLAEHGGRTGVDGLRDDPAWIAKFINECPGSASSGPFSLNGQLALTDDPPHERENIATQIGDSYPWHGPNAPMNGFMKSYAQTRLWSDKLHEVMGYYTENEVPITRYFADEFTICDRWFACLPTSTQPNRLMAMAGYTLIDNTFGTILPDHELVYDWLQQRSSQVDWRVYHEGWPFFMLMPQWSTRILTDSIFQDRFRWLDCLERDLAQRPSKPQVIFVEPKYSNDPMRTAAPSDDHSPSSIAGGQGFLARVYRALRQNSEVWNRSLMLITYDENGGLFDHVSPFPLRTEPPPGATWNDPRPFVTTGIRVPGLIISPLVDRGRVFHDPLDHTAILKFLGDRFGSGSYNSIVNRRKGTGSITDVLNLNGVDSLRTNIPDPPPYRTIPSPPEPITRKGAMDYAFEAALLKVRANQAGPAAAKFPELRDFLVNPLLLEAERQLDRDSFTLDPTVNSMLLPEFVKQGELKLLGEPQRRPDAADNLRQFIEDLENTTRQMGGGTTVHSAAFFATKELGSYWPFC